MNLKMQLRLFLLLLQLCVLQATIAKGQQLLPYTVQDSIALKRLTTIEGHILTKDIITVKYHTLNGNDPLKNKNWVGIWQGSELIYDTPPLRKALITGTTSTGDLAFDSLALQNKDYIIGYGSGEGNNKVSATIYFKAGILPFEPGIAFATNLKVLDYGNNFLVVSFQTPLGNIPRTNENWLGIWKGKSISNTGINLIKKRKINSVISNDTIAINNLNLTRNTWYTLTYALGSSYTDIVATYTFFNQ